MLNVCIQVNISGEENKSGVNPRQLIELAKKVTTLPRLSLRGLMAIPEATDDKQLQRRRFAQLRELYLQVQAVAPTIDTISMGMSGDMEQAISEGSTMVRIGSGIFGTRT
jgi:hypothetical protein